MLLSTVPVIDIPDLLTSDLVPVGRFRSPQEAQEYALVILAMRLDCLITVEEEGGYLVHGEEKFVEAIQEEFRLYREEKVCQPSPVAIPIFGSGVSLRMAVRSSIDWDMAKVTAMTFATSLGK